MTESNSSPTRSWLFTPATRPDRFGKAAAAGADLIMIDLEDAVAPSEKDKAPETALGYLCVSQPSR